MSDGILTILKLSLLAMIYLFLARVVWVVSAEMRGGAAAAVPEPETAGGRRKRWQVVVVAPAHARREVDVDGEVTIGRAGGCGLSMPDDTFMSQVHARVFDRDGNVYVDDLGSTNGTFVDGERVEEPRRLRKGDRIQVGETVLEVRR